MSQANGFIIFNYSTPRNNLLGNYPSLVPESMLQQLNHHVAGSLQPLPDAMQKNMDKLQCSANYTKKNVMASSKNESQMAGFTYCTLIR